MYRYVFWDFDGTLFDTYPVMAHYFVRAMRETGREANEDEVRRLMQISAGTAVKFYNDKYGDISDAEARFGELMNAHRGECLPFEGINEILDDIIACGGANFLLTHRGENAFQMFDMHGMNGKFKDYVLGTMDFPRKPDPAGLNYLMEKHSVPRDEAIVIGDRDLDVLAGVNAGIASCGFTMGGGETPEHAEFIAKNTVELRNVLGL